jgi:hypothetical protein
MPICSNSLSRKRTLLGPQVSLPPLLNVIVRPKEGARRMAMDRRAMAFGTEAPGLTGEQLGERSRALLEA